MHFNGRFLSVRASLIIERYGVDMQIRTIHIVHFSRSIVKLTKYVISQGCEGCGDGVENPWSPETSATNYMYFVTSLCFKNWYMPNASIIFHPAILWFWVLIKGVKSYSVLFSHGPNKAFLVPGSRRATERNCNSISADVTDDTIEND